MTQAQAPAVPKIVNAYLDESEIVLVERAGDGGVRERRQRAEYVTWHRSKDVGPLLMRELKSCDLVTRITVEDDWVRVVWFDEMCRRRGRKDLREEDNIESFEGDLDPVLLWLVESRAEIQKPRRCYLDVETDSRVPLSKKEEMRILSWAVVDGATGEELSGVLGAEDDASERKLLRELADVLGRFDQICVWEGNWRGGEFDSVVVPARFRRLGIDVDPRRWIWLNQLDVWDRFNLAESGAEAETLKLDEIAFEQLGERKEKVPKAVVERFGERAKRGLGSITWDLWAEGGELRDLLVRYNVHDAVLLYRLEKRKGFLALFQARCEICGVVPENRSLSTTRFMDGMLLRLARERKMRAPTLSWREGAGEKFKGAFVLDTMPIDPAWRERRGMTTGIVPNVHVCDFSGMYPSIIISWNLSTETKCPPEVYAEYKRTGALPPGVALSPLTGLLTYVDRPALVPDALRLLMKWRKEFADLAASLPPGTDEWQDAYNKSDQAKKTQNGFYGGMGTPNSRWYDREVAESTTQNGAYLIQEVVRHARARKMEPVFGDTDSCGITDASREGFAAFVGWCNRKMLPGVVARVGCKESRVSLAFEKTFGRFIATSKKFYIGSWSHYKGTAAKANARPEIKGVAYKRGDKGKLARELQGRVIDLLLGGGLVRKDDEGRDVPVNDGLRIAFDEDGARVAKGNEVGEPVERPTSDRRVFEALLRAARDHVLLEELPIDEVRFSKGLSKSLREYPKDASDAHVRVARELAARGRAIGVGVKIDFVVVDGSSTPMQVVPAEDYGGDCDRAYLWERVFSPTCDLLEAAFPGGDWATWGEVRAKKPKGRAAKVPEEQLGLAISPAGKKSPTRVDELAVPTWSPTPLTIEVPEEAGEAALRRVREALLANPGPRAAELVIALRTGARAVLRTPFRVMTGPRLKDAVDRAIAGGGEFAP